eukprot:TRINITY_DN72081_c0_g1_i1.p1 TRINITY_DN72081_c0_g1~~TRINITY_DN72081_c0_g1_i1.p1  ORF type:complete len:883 (+),score=157.74 TRINITY_DN72081_c0_g1_i1:53-2701(+)
MAAARSICRRAWQRVKIDRKCLWCDTRALATSIDSGPLASLPQKADVVIVGGGVVGCSAAYHIRKRLPDRSVLLLEQGSLGCGTTWHAAGLVGLMRSSKSETLLSGVYGARLYQELEELTGLSSGFKRCGSLSLARNAERLEMLRRTAARARSYGLEAQEVSLADANELCGGMLSTDPSRFVGAISLPGDGAIDASNVCALLAAAARRFEASIFEGVKVTAVQQRAGGLEGFDISTDRGDVHAGAVVNSSGQWARSLGQLSGVDIPLHSCEHFYAYTRPGSLSVPRNFPIVRDPDGWLYFREWSGGLLAGSFEPVPKPCFERGRIPDKFEFSLLDNDWDHFLPYLADAGDTFPDILNAEVDLLNGPESFTMDNAYLMGEVPGLRNYFVAAGMNSSGIASAGGVGFHIAEWMANGLPAKHVWSVDIRRVHAFQANQKYIQARACESLGDHYRMIAPKRETTQARGLRRSPLFDVLEADGARFGQKAGWERPNYFSLTERALHVDPFQGPGLQPETWGEAAWMEPAAEEHLACRSAAALFDVSSFAKLLVVGDGAAAALSRICGNEIRGRAGFSTYTQMLNVRGGIEADVTVRELAPDRWVVLTATDKGIRDRAWIEAAVEGQGVHVIDVTPMYSVLALMGPLSPQILARASGLKDDDAAALLAGWKPNETRELDLGFTRVMAIRTSYVGEAAGWELHMEADMARHVYQTLKEVVAVSPTLALQNAGYLAIDSLRIEAGRLAWGHELTPEETPLEAGLGFAVKIGKPGGFIGEDAIAAQKAQGVAQRCCLFVAAADAAGPYIWGGEPILMDGSYTGLNVTSGARVPVAGCPNKSSRTMALGYVTSNRAAPINKSWLEQHRFEIEVGSHMVPVTPKLLPLQMSKN